MSARFKLPGRAIPMFIVVAALAGFTIFFTSRLQDRAERARAVEASLSNVALSLRAATTAPGEGDGLDAARARWTEAQRQFDRTSKLIRSTFPTAQIDGLERDFNAVKKTSVQFLNALGEDFDWGTLNFPPEVMPLMTRLLGQFQSLDKAISTAAQDYRSRAESASNQSRFGSAGMILLLLTAFTLFLRRSVIARAQAEALTEENERLLALSRTDARTDTLTGMPNRRALADDLEAAFADGAEPELAIVMYDLDGFKAYNDTFGHPAGDALLTRVGSQLTAAVADFGKAYRMGGDEFCVVARCAGEQAEDLAKRGADSLATSGEGFDVTSSLGLSLMPLETKDGDEAFDLADQRLYGAKASRRSRFGVQDERRLLIQILMEQNGELVEHVTGVARLAVETARELDVAPAEVERIRLAAELHDIGKTAIPDSILNKPSALDDDEWQLMRSHTVVGERIVRASPGLAHTASLIRSSHERVDGNGYPDGLSGDDIPLGSRIVFVCDSFDAMVSDRPYRKGMPVEEALDEVRRNVGTQFDAAAAAALIAVVERRAEIELAA